MVSFISVEKWTFKKMAGRKQTRALRTYKTFQNLCWPLHFIGLLSVILYAFWFPSAFTKGCNWTETVEKVSSSYWRREWMKDHLFWKISNFQRRIKEFCSETEEGNKNTKIESEAAEKKEIILPSQRFKRDNFYRTLKIKQ